MLWRACRGLMAPSGRRRRGGPREFAALPWSFINDSVDLCYQNRSLSTTLDQDLNVLGDSIDISSESFEANRKSMADLVADLHRHIDKVEQSSSFFLSS